MFTLYYYYFCVNLVLDLLILFSVVFFVFTITYFYLFSSVFVKIYNFPFCYFFSSISFSFFYDLINVFFPSLLVYLLVEPSFMFIYSYSSLKEVYFSLLVKSSQWFWSYFYNDMSYDSFVTAFNMFNSFSMISCDNSILVPLGVSFSVFFTSSDVMHSFTLFGSSMKIDCIPGSMNCLNLTIVNSGVFFGMCSELCGMGHSFMPIQLECY